MYHYPRFLCVCKIAFALGMEGLIPEAIREMESLRSKHEVELGVGMALLYFHGKAKMVDRYAEMIQLYDGPVVTLFRR